MGFILRPETSGSGPGNPTDQHQMATRRHARRSARSDSRRSRAGSAVPPRAAIVWMSLVGAMTTVGGGLLLLDGGRRSPLDGVRLPAATALMAVSTPRSLEGVLETREPLDRDRWLAIMVHHSGAAFGTPQSLEREHRAMGLRGLGHHFVIGNGNGMGDAEVFVGYRWLDQLPGAHAAGDHEVADWHNRHAISICLVGDGNRRGFTPAQLQRLVDLVGTLARDLRIPTANIVLHSDASEVSDPGVAFPAAAFREMVAGLD